MGSWKEINGQKGKIQIKHTKKLSVHIYKIESRRIKKRSLVVEFKSCKRGWLNIKIEILVSKILASNENFEAYIIKKGIVFVG